MPALEKDNLKKSKELRKAVGAVLAAPVVAPLIALSGFMPVPAVVQSARAGSATLSVKGSFVTGITLVKKADIKFGKMVSTDTGGKISLTTAGAYANSAKGVGISGKAAGQYTYKAVTSNANFNLTVKGIGKLTLGNTLGGHAKQGTAKLTKVKFGKAFGTAKAAVTCTVGVGTTCKKSITNANFTKKSATVNLGGIISWTTPQPIGAFGQTVTIIMAF